MEKSMQLLRFGRTLRWVILASALVSHSVLAGVQSTPTGSMYVDDYHGYGLRLPDGIRVENVWNRGENIEFKKNGKTIFVGQIHDYRKDFEYSRNNLKAFGDTLKAYAFNKSSLVFTADGPCSSSSAKSDSLHERLSKTGRRLVTVFLTATEEHWECEEGDTSYVNKKSAGPVFWADITRPELRYALEIRPYNLDQSLDPAVQQLILGILDTLWLVADNDLRR